jgi:hypothetical protein
MSAMLEYTTTYNSYPRDVTCAVPDPMLCVIHAQGTTILPLEPVVPVQFPDNAEKQIDPAVAERV